MELSKEEILNSKSIQEYFGDKFTNLAQNKSVFIEFRKQLSKLLDKNSYAFSKFGNQFILNEKDEESFLKILETSKNDIENAYNQSPYLKTLGSLNIKDQIKFSIPFILLSAEYLKIGKKEEARVLYLFTFFKPFASVLFKYFRLPPNEDRMNYTIETATDRFDIKKYGTFGLIQKKSDTSLENYESAMKTNLTDKNIYIIFTSGIYSRINDSVKKIRNEYEKNKDKYLPFESSTVMATGDSGDLEAVERNIKSDSAVKAEIARSAALKFAKNPVNEQIINIAVQYAFKTNSPTPYMRDMLREIVINIGNDMSDYIMEFFETLLSSVLFNINPNTGEKYTGADLKSPVFIEASLNIFKAHHTADKNILRNIEILKIMLEKCSTDYMISGTTKKEQLKKAIFFYLVLVCRSSIN